MNLDRVDNPLKRLTAGLGLHSGDPFDRRLLAFTIALVAIVWVLLAVDVWQLHLHRIESARLQAASVARTMSERVIRTYRMVDHALRNIEQELREHNAFGDANEVARNLKQNALDLDEVLTIGFDDTTGRSVAQSNPAIRIGVDYSASEFFRAHVTDASLGLYTEQPIRGLATGRRVFTLSRRVADRNGKFAGVLVAPILTDVLAAAFDEARIGPRGAIGLIHVPTSRVIARQPEFDKTFSMPVRNQELIQALAAEPTGRVLNRNALDGEDRLISYTKVSDLPLAIAVGISIKDIQDQLMRDLAGYILLALALTASLAAGGLAILRAHRRELALHDALAEKEALFGAFCAASPVGMYMLDPHLNYRMINQALAEINGVAIEDTLGRSVKDVVPALADRMEAIHREVAASGRAMEEIEITGEAASTAGKSRSWRVSSFPIRGPQGQGLGVGGVVTETTDIKDAAATLQRWRQVFEQADWGVVVGSADGKTLEMMNPAYARMHGYSVEELTGRPIETVYAPEVRKDVPAIIARNHKLGHRRFESLHVHRDGHTFPVLVDATAVRDDEGKVLFRVVNVQDITDLRRAQDDMRVAREFFKTLFDSAPVGMAIADLSGRYIDVNRAMCEFVGYAETELLEMSFRDITHPDDVGENDALRELLLEGGSTAIRMEKRYMHKDGRILWALMIVTMVRDQAGKPAFTIGQMMDIGERKRMDDALLRQDAELKEALRIGRIGRWDYDPLSGTTTWSALLCEIVGHDPAHPTPDKSEISKYYSPASLAAHKAAIDYALATGMPYRLEIEIRRANGEAGWLLIRGEAVRDVATGAVAGLRGTAQDITENKKAELELQRTREQLRALSTYQETILEEERKRIAREVHDEMGQLLTALKMDISLIRMRFGKEAEIREKAEDMRVLVEKTIQVVRHVASNLRPAALDLGLPAAIEWLAEDFEHRWEIECEVRLGSGETALDDSQATAVFRVVQESLTNVARHADASKVVIKVDGQDGRLRLRIWDNGCGFDPFQVREKTGFGILGMRERILALGGSLTIDSQPGIGTRVDIDLPGGDATT